MEPTYTIKSLIEELTEMSKHLPKGLYSPVLMGDDEGNYLHDTSIRLCYGGDYDYALLEYDMHDTSGEQVIEELNT